MRHNLREFSLLEPRSCSGRCLVRIKFSATDCIFFFLTTEPNPFPWGLFSSWFSTGSSLRLCVFSKWQAEICWSIALCMRNVNLSGGHGLMMIMCKISHSSQFSSCESCASTSDIVHYLEKTSLLKNILINNKFVLTDDCTNVFFLNFFVQTSVKPT